MNISNIYINDNIENNNMYYALNLKYENNFLKFNTFAEILSIRNTFTFDILSMYKMVIRINNVELFSQIENNIKHKFLNKFNYENIDIINDSYISYLFEDQLEINLMEMTDCFDKFGEIVDFTKIVGEKVSIRISIPYVWFSKKNFGLKLESDSIIILK